MNEEVTVNSNRRSLVALFGIGFVPLIIAWVIFFYFPNLMPSGTTNEGDLISPAIVASQLDLESKTGEWTLIVPMGEVCDENCKELLYLARQVNVALGKESTRVHRLLLTTSPAPQIDSLVLEYPDMTVAATSATKVSSTLGNMERIYLMDPLGNIFMVYSKEKAGKPMLKDIKHLLKISNIG